MISVCGDRPVTTIRSGSPIGALGGSTDKRTVVAPACNEAQPQLVQQSPTNKASRKHLDTPHCTDDSECVDEEMALSLSLGRRTSRGLGGTLLLADRDVAWRIVMSPGSAH